MNYTLNNMQSQWYSSTIYKEIPNFCPYICHKMGRNEKKYACMQNGYADIAKESGLGLLTKNLRKDIITLYFQKFERMCLY